MAKKTGGKRKKSKKKGKKVKSLTKTQLARLKVGRTRMRAYDDCVCTTAGGDSGITKTSSVK